MSTTWDWSPVFGPQGAISNYLQNMQYQKQLQAMMGPQSDVPTPGMQTNVQLPSTKMPGADMFAPSQNGGKLAPSAYSHGSFSPPGMPQGASVQGGPISVGGGNIDVSTPSVGTHTEFTGPVGQALGNDQASALMPFLQALGPRGLPMLMQTTQNAMQHKQDIADRKVTPMSDQEAQAAGLRSGGVYGRDVSGNISAIQQSDVPSEGAIKAKEAESTFTNQLPMTAAQKAAVQDARLNFGETHRHNVAMENEKDAAVSAPVTVEASDPKNPGQRTQFLAQQDKRTGQWYTGDQNRIPLTDVMLPGGVPGGGRAAAQISRIMSAAKDVSTGLQNVSQLPITASTGLMGLLGGKQEVHGLFDASRTVLANQMTPQEVQSTKAMYVGIAKAIGTLDAGGMQTSDTFLKQIGGLLPAEGDTHLTKLLKLAELRQQADNALESQLNGPLLSSQQKVYAKQLRVSLEKSIPWSPTDVLALSKSDNPNAKISDFATKSGLGGNGGAGGATESKVINGVTYHKVGDKWMQE